MLTIKGRYDAVFVGMVPLEDKLKVNVKHIGMRDGNIIVNVQILNQRGEMIDGAAKVTQPTTVYVFTGQES
jgi:fatty acid synthase subunit alpha, fungi type